MRGEATLFTRNDEVEAQWRICDPIVSAWAANAAPLPPLRGRQPGPGRGATRCCATDTSGGRSERRARRGARERLSRRRCRPSTTPSGRRENTTPAAVEAALRELLIERHNESDGYVPARVLNMVCIVERRWSGEIANRLRRVGRYHASRTIVCAVTDGRATIDAVATGLPPMRRPRTASTC